MQDVAELITVPLLTSILRERIQKYDVVVPSLSLHYQAAPGEVIRYRIRSGMAAFCTDNDPAIVVHVPSSRTPLSIPDVYPMLAEFKANADIGGAPVEKVIDTLALDLVRQKERTFFNIVEMSCKHSDAYHVKHVMEALDPFKCTACSELHPLHPIAQIRQTLTLSPRVLYADAGGMCMVASEPCSAWWGPPLTHGEIGLGCGGAILGLPIITNAFRDEQIEMVGYRVENQQPVKSVRFIALNRNVRHILPDPCVKIEQVGSKIHASHFAAMVVPEGGVAINDHYLES